MKVIVEIDNQKLYEVTVEELGAQEGIRQLLGRLIIRLIEAGALNVEILDDKEAK